MVPTAFSATTATTVDSGQTIDLAWTVANQSGSVGLAVQPCFDRVFLPTDATFGGDSALLQVARTTDLAAGGSYNQTGTITISSAQATGTYFLFLQTDSFSQLTEENESNNVNGPIQIMVRQPDLVPTAFTGIDLTF